MKIAARNCELSVIRDIDGPPLGEVCELEVAVHVVLMNGVDLILKDQSQNDLNYLGEFR
jgi:hypothetical protein